MARDDTDPYQGHDPGCICADCCDADMTGIDIHPETIDRARETVRDLWNAAFGHDPH